MTISVDVSGVEELQSLLSSMPQQLFGNAKEAFREHGLIVQEKIKDRIKNGTPLHRRSGELSRSIKPKLTGTSLQNLHSSVFTNSKYAGIHETGGTITAKNAYKNMRGGPYLNIPTSANKTPSGVTRLSPENVFSAGGTIGTAYVYIEGQGMRSRMALILNDEAMYTFAKSVTIPARLEFIKTGEDEIPTLLSKLGQVLLDGLE